MPQLKRKILVNTGSNENDDLRSIAVVGQAWGGGDTHLLQIQLSDDSNDFFMDLNINEVHLLRDALNEWISLFK